MLADVGQATEGEGGFGAEAVVERATRTLSDDLGGEDEVRGRLVFEGSAVEVDDVGYAPEITLRAFGGVLAFNKPVRRNVLWTGLVVDLASEEVATVELRRLLAEAVTDETRELVVARVVGGEGDVDSGAVERGFGGEEVVECGEHWTGRVSAV